VNINQTPIGGKDAPSIVRVVGSNNSSATKLQRYTDLRTASNKKASLPNLLESSVFHSLNSVNAGTNRKKSARLPEKQKLETFSNQSGVPKPRYETEYSQNSRKSHGTNIGVGYD
jgi:hypothetical protein